MLAATGSFIGLPQRPRKLRDVAQGFLPNFGTTPALRTATRARIEHRLGPLFDRCVDDGTAAHTAPAAPLSETPETAAREGTEKQAGPTKPWARSRYEPARLIEGLLRAGSLGRKGRWRVQRRAIQGELALARIRVVRNDLHDTDFELVPAQAKVTGEGPAAGLKSGGNRGFGLGGLPGRLGTVWRRLVGGVARRMHPHTAREMQVDGGIEC